MAEENASPISAAKPPLANPMGGHAATLKLKPVIRKPPVGGAGLRPNQEAPLPSATSRLDQLRSATQKLKGLTQQIPQQAILHKTGIIAEQALTEAQKQASKSRTARISLSDAIGVAPVKDEVAPMKTIRIKRPVDMPMPSKSATPALAPAESAATPTPTPAPVPASAPAEPVAKAAAPEAAGAAKSETVPTMTQRKTLKIARPGGGVRPTGKIGIKKPTAPAPAKPAGESAGETNAKLSDDAVASLDTIADIPEMPAATQPFAPAADGVCPPDRIPDVGKTCQFLGLLVQIAACVAMGFLAFKLYESTLLPAYCGGTVM